MCEKANYARKDPREKEGKYSFLAKVSFAQNCSSPSPLRYGGDAGMVHEVVLKICSLFLLLLLVGLPKYALFEGKAIVSRSGRGGVGSFLVSPPLSVFPTFGGVTLFSLQPCLDMGPWGHFFWGKRLWYGGGGQRRQTDAGGKFYHQKYKKRPFWSVFPGQFLCGQRRCPPD